MIGLNRTATAMVVGLVSVLMVGVGCTRDQRGFTYSVPRYNEYPLTAGDWRDQNGDNLPDHWEFIDVREGWYPHEEFLLIYNLFNLYAGGIPLEMRVTGPNGVTVLREERRLTRQNEVVLHRVRAADLIERGGHGVYTVEWILNGVKDFGYIFSIGNPPVAVQNRRPKTY
jgi:hypothetical protein